MPDLVDLERIFPDQEWLQGMVDESSGNVTIHRRTFPGPRDPLIGENTDENR